VQAPPLQTSGTVGFTSQVVPFAICAAVSMHVDVPVAHEVVPARHGFGFVAQPSPAVQALQAPPLHTWFVPQVVPFGSGVAVVSHVSTPVAQEVAPVWHGSGSVSHATPAVQLAQAPPLQTRFVPQTSPFGSGTAALSTHVSAPVAHEVSPVRQKVGFVVQSSPAVQAMQVPLPLQTWFVPQTRPADFGVAVFSQVSEPVAHDVTPSTHAFVLYAQGWPAVQALQTPPRQTWSGPQVVPFGFAVPVSMQTDAPVAQEVVPSTQLFGFVAQASAAVQALQAPPLQTAGTAGVASMTHAVPFGMGAAVSTQVS
jgi:hypothetical protein